jgi:F-type H+-transporting ATPase subunit gamma
MVEREGRQARRLHHRVVRPRPGGGLNNNLFRKLLAEIREWQEKGVEIDVVTIGQKASVFFRRLKVNMLAGHPPGRQAAGGTADRRDQGDAGRVHRRQARRVFLCYNDFVNTMTQKPTFDQLLPLPASDTQVARTTGTTSTNPTRETVLDGVLTRYVESLVYQAVLENVASEHAARMVAMKAASDNATKLIGTCSCLQQGAPGSDHQEISEIVGGAAAV